MNEFPDQQLFTTIDQVYQAHVAASKAGVRGAMMLHALQTPIEVVRRGFAAGTLQTICGRNQCLVTSLFRVERPVLRRISFYPCGACPRLTKRGTRSDPNSRTDNLIRRQDTR